MYYSRITLPVKGGTDHRRTERLVRWSFSRPQIMVDWAKKVLVEVVRSGSVLNIVYFKGEINKIC